MELSLVILGAAGLAMSAVTLIVSVWRWRKRRAPVAVEKKVIKVGEVQKKREENLTLPGASDEKPESELQKRDEKDEDKLNQLERLAKWLRKE